MDKHEDLLETLSGGPHKVSVVKENMLDDTQSISDDAKLKDVTEMAVDIKLFDLGGGRSEGRHCAISSLIGIKDSHIRFDRVNVLADGFARLTRV